MSSGGGAGSGGQGLWKLEVARQVLVEDYGRRLDWVAVAKAFDHDGFNIPDQVKRCDNCVRKGYYRCRSSLDQAQ